MSDGLDQGMAVLIPSWFQPLAPLARPVRLAKPQPDLSASACALRHVARRLRPSESVHRICSCM